MKNKNAVVALAFAFAVVGVHAELFNRGNGLVFDSDLNITWLADFNSFGTQAIANPNLINDTVLAVPTLPSVAGSYTSYGVTTGTPGQYALSADDFLVRPGASSLMTWFGAQAWASQLVYQGYDDWRVAGNFSFENGQFTNEIRHLWMNELEITALTPLGNAANLDLFIGSPNWGGGYWLGANIDSIGVNGYVSSCACDLSSIGGSSTVLNKWHVMAVRDGDVISSTVPEPKTYTLILTGLLGLVIFNDRRRKFKVL